MSDLFFRLKDKASAKGMHLSVGLGGDVMLGAPKKKAFASLIGVKRPISPLGETILRYDAQKLGGPIKAIKYALKDFERAFASLK
jgi:hypothetical protein